jgi:UDP-GlcNAc:undecaprenyl-phosphate GlcNAc-1-phosphate transferase
MGTDGLAMGLALALCAIATFAVREVALGLGVVSEPDPFVPQHTRRVATAGGVAVALASAIVAFGLNVDFDPIGPLAVGTAIVLAAGVLDDVRALTPWQKLALQVVAAASAAALGLRSELVGSAVLDGLVTVIWIVIVVNAVNLTDVCDGLVTGLAVVALLALALVEPEVRSLALVVAGACLGFLVFNAPPASIFLGDAGSNLLGFLLGGLTLAAVQASGTWRGFVQIVLILGVFLFELVFVVAARTRRGVPWWQGSGDHVALRLQAAGLTRWGADTVVWSAAALLGIAAWLAGLGEG